MPAKRRSKVLCQRAVPYELYKGLTFTTIWLEAVGLERKCHGLCYLWQGLSVRKKQILGRGSRLFAKYKRLCKCLHSAFRYRHAVAPGGIEYSGNGGRAMPTDCRNQILSNSYYDAITDFPIQALNPDNLELCYADIDNLYNVLYFDRALLTNVQPYFFSYRSVPKLYGLMAEGGGGGGGFEPASLLASGIIQIQREPLALTGRGVVICVIGTGIDSTRPAVRKEDGTSRSLAICTNLSFFIVYPTFRSIDFYIYDTLFYFFCQCAWRAGKKFHN